MAWTAPPTLTDGQVLTGAHTQIWRDDLNETAVAKATTAGRIFVATGTNAIAERAIVAAFVGTTENTSSTSFVDLTTPGPAVTVTTGTTAMVLIACTVENNTSTAFAQASYAISGATTQAANLDRCIQIRAAATNQNIRASAVTLETGLTAGSNVFTMKYVASSGGGIGAFGNRRITVMGL